MALPIDNISMGGLFVRCSNPLSVGTPVMLEVVRPGAQPLKVVGTVVVSVDGVDALSASAVPGMGVQFEGLDAATARGLSSLLMTLVDGPEREALEAKAAMVAAPRIVRAASAPPPAHHPTQGSEQVMSSRGAFDFSFTTLDPAHQDVPLRAFNIPLAAAPVSGANGRGLKQSTPPHELMRSAAMERARTEADGSATRGGSPEVEGSLPSHPSTGAAVHARAPRTDRVAHTPDDARGAANGFVNGSTAPNDAPAAANGFADPNRKIDGCTAPNDAHAAPNDARAAANDARTAANGFVDGRTAPNDAREAAKGFVDGRTALNDARDAAKDFVDGRTAPAMDLATATAARGPSVPVHPARGALMPGAPDNATPLLAPSRPVTVAESAKLLVQVRGLLEDLGETQTELSRRAREIDELRDRLHHSFEELLKKDARIRELEAELARGR